jgi:hypothetical protein
MKMNRHPLVVATVLASGCALFGALAGHAVPAPPAAGANFQVNVVTEGSQDEPAVAQDTAGDSVVVWVDRGAAPVTVKARRFDPTGAPAGGEIVVATGGAIPRVAMTPEGAFAVVWQNGELVFLRRYDRLGRPEGDVVAVQPPAGDPTNATPDVAMDAGGTAFVVWVSTRSQGDDSLLLQRFDRANQPLGAREEVANGLHVNPRVAVNAADSLLVTWDDGRGAFWDVRARRFDAPTGAWAPETRISTSGSGMHRGGNPILYREGDGAVVFWDLTAGTVQTRRLDAHGVAVDAEIPVSLNVASFTYPAAAADAEGTALVAWQGADSVLHAAFFDRAWQRLGPDFAVSSPRDDFELAPAVAAGGTGNLLVAWASSGFPFLFPGYPPSPGRDGSESGVYAQRFQAPACAAGSATLCLGDGQRFAVQVSWKNPYTGETGTGRSQPLTGDTGAFWFFDPANLEVMIKVLDGRLVNGNFWVFYGSLSNVEYTVSVTDAKTGAVKTYHNAPLQFSSRADVDAFPGGAGVAAVAPPLVPPATGASALAPLVPSRRAAPFAAADCTPTPFALCLQNRFQVEVSLIDPRTGTFGPASAVTLTEDTGVFWFFDPGNLEVMVKVLDGSAINGHFWVFYGGLSDVNYEITVTDKATGVQRSYNNPLHHLASAADLDAFTAGPTAGK